MSSDAMHVGKFPRAGEEHMKGSTYCSLSKHGLCGQTELHSYHFDLLLSDLGQLTYGLQASGLLSLNEENHRHLSRLW